jgi:hypothetical protein
MAKKERPSKGFARTAPKSQEKYLIDNAKKLQQDPFLILPKCTDESKKYFQKLHKQIAKVHRFHDNEAKLEKLSNKRGLDGALAGTLLLAISEKAPYLAALTFPTGDITYALRGKADKEKLIAVQHFDDPIFRLRGIKDLVFRKKLHVYSWEKGYICTGKEAQPPAEFIDFIKNKIGFQSAKGVIYCPHITPETVRDKRYASLNYLLIEWKSAHLRVALCENCAKSTKNTMFIVSKFMLQRNLSDDFSIEVVTPAGKHSTTSAQHPTTQLQKYLSGDMTDYEFIKHNVRSQEEHVKQRDEKILVLDGVSYGTDIPRFVDALNPSPYEKAALEFILQKTNEPLILTKITPSKLLERYWEQYGNEFLTSLVNDTKTAESLFRLDDSPSNIIQFAFEYTQRQKILSQLPSFKSLPPLASYADTVARAYRAYGETKALAEIKRHPDTPKGKSLGYAFFLVLGKTTEIKWKYSKEEIEYGEFLQPQAKRLLDCAPEDYTDVLQELLVSSGTSETVPT